MSTPPNEPPRFVTCSCQHCNGSIEFDACDFDKGETRTVPCPHCGLETIIFVPPSLTPSTLLKIITVPKRKSGGRKWIFLAVAVVIVAAIITWCSSTIQDFWFLLFFLLFLAAVLGIYFLPTIIAFMAKKKNALAIFVVNFFLGWTLVGWVVALAWSVTQDDKI